MSLCLQWQNERQRRRYWINKATFQSVARHDSLQQHLGRGEEGQLILRHLNPREKFPTFHNSGFKEVSPTYLATHLITDFMRRKRLLLSRIMYIIKLAHFPLLHYSCTLYVYIHVVPFMHNLGWFEERSYPVTCPTRWSSISELVDKNTGVISLFHMLNIFHICPHTHA